MWGGDLVTLETFWLKGLATRSMFQHTQIRHGLRGAILGDNDVERSLTFTKGDIHLDLGIDPFGPGSRHIFIR